LIVYTECIISSFTKNIEYLHHVLSKWANFLVADRGFFQSFSS
jgi:hypothetical protein